MLMWMVITATVTIMTLMMEDGNNGDGYDNDADDGQVVFVAISMPFACGVDSVVRISVINAPTLWATALEPHYTWI